MSIISSYLDYLPPALWAESVDPTRFLGRFLCGFEQMLTGIADDATPICGDRRTYQPLEKVIDRLPDLFDPWQTPPQFLPYLASWLGLDFEPNWTSKNEYQARWMIEQTMSAYRVRGLKEGLFANLDIYAASETRPRIVIDDGEAVWRGVITEDGNFSLHVLTFSQHTVPDSASDPALPVLIHPVALAVDSNNDYLVVDMGSLESEVRRPVLCRLSSLGEVLKTARPMLKSSEGTESPLLEGATAMMVDRANRCIVVTNRRERTVGGEPKYSSAIYRLKPDTFELDKVLLTDSWDAIYPVDIVNGSGPDQFAVLDMGIPRNRVTMVPHEESKPRIWIISRKKTSDDWTAEAHDLPGVMLPTALAKSSDGYIVADARQQSWESEKQQATLWKVKPRDTDPWDVKPLWGEPNTPKDNPLVYPTALVVENDHSVLVCDRGSRLACDDPTTNIAMAEPPMVYRVIWTATPPETTSFVAAHQLIHPVKMVRDRTGAVIIADCGETATESPGWSSPQTKEWRTRGNEFGIVTYFSKGRTTTSQLRNAIRQQIRHVVEEHKPAHTICTFR